ncbi:MAG: winged helix-turn-helix domain-containing protein, partial [Saprospiraceae bacterium]|nr:winged helix-turn-helix domain-containing protein [Saprospiraceae bacterium]
MQNIFLVIFRYQKHKRISKKDAEFIQKEFDTTYCPSGVSRLLHRLSFSYKKTKHEPSKADKAVQKAFLEQMLLL